MARNPVRALNKVVLPQFGLPTRATLKLEAWLSFGTDVTILGTYETVIMHKYCHANTIVNNPHLIYANLLSICVLAKNNGVKT